MRCLLPWTSEAARVLRWEHARSPSPARKSRAAGGDECRWSLAENQLGGAARNHMGWRIRWSSNDPRHDGRVGHAQARKAVHAEQWVDDREFVHAHFACADRMSEARRAQPG